MVSGGGGQTGGRIRDEEAASSNHRVDQSRHTTNHSGEQAPSSVTKSQNQPQNHGGTESTSKAIQQFTEDARLHAVFEQSGESGKSFDYNQSLKTTTHGSSEPEQQITAYLSRIQRGGFIQPFGCLIAVDESTFTIIGFSENAGEMLGLMSQCVPSIEDKSEILRATPAASRGPFLNGFVD